MDERRDSYLKKEFKKLNVPLSCISPCTNVAIKRLGGLLSEKFNTLYSSIMDRICCHLNLVMLRALLMCLSGAIPSLWHPARILTSVLAEYAAMEGQIQAAYGETIYEWLEYVTHVSLMWGSAS